jgi:hypothetical protein
MADQRMLAHGSVLLMVGPSFMGETRAGKSLDPGLTFDRMMSSEDRSHVPSFIDRYLSDLGIDVVLTGNEMVPRRETVSRMVRAAAAMGLEDDRWARPCARMGNIIALAIRNAISLPIEPADSSQMVRDLTFMAQKFYERALKDPALERTVKANMALLQHWNGTSDEALASLLRLVEEPASQDEKAEIDTKRSQVLHDLGKDAEATALLKRIPEAKMPARGKDLLSELEARQ